MELKQLGPYQIGRCLGRGGMGTVYAAVETDTGRPAAVKVLAPQLAASEGFRVRFEAEIDSLKQLEHPNIVRLYGYGQQDHFVYYAMELVEGSSLEDELRQGRRFDWREVCDLGIKLCRALKLAHDHGIIHRDIKPGNLLWSPDDQIKLTDFGIARLFGNTGLTNEGGVLGTAEYMAPEQADGRRVTHHCDLYSLGGVLYALLAGRPPFRSKSMLELLQMQRFSRPEPVRRYAQDTPAEFEHIIGQLLEKDPKDRFPNALMVARRLEAMQKALTLNKEEPSEESPPAGSEPASFVLEPGEAPDPPARGVTVDADLPTGAPAPTRSDDRSAVALAEASDSALTAAEDEEGTRQLAPPENRFTTIEDERRTAELRARQEHPLISVPTWMLVISLLSTGLIIWYALQPASANSLYARIASVADEDEKRLLEVTSEVTDFLDYYPDDPRRAEVIQYRRRIDLMRRERTARARAKSLVRRYPNAPIGPEYLAAIELAETNPEQAAIRLQALIVLYENSRPSSDNYKFVEAALELLPLIQRKIQERASRQLKLIRQRLLYVDRIKDSRPDDARVICQAIVNLYNDRAWARGVVTQAQSRLDELSETEPPEAEDGDKTPSS